MTPYRGQLAWSAQSLTQKNPGLEVQPANKIWLTSPRILEIADRGGGRSGIERRRFTYSAHIPDRRSGLERRSGEDRRSGFDRRSGIERRKAIPVKISGERRSGVDRRSSEERRTSFS